jgi:hypothetical protein
MYDKYVAANKVLNDKYISIITEDEEWKTNCYGDIPSLITRTETVESVFVTNARRITTARKAVWCVLSGMIFVLLWIIVQKG